MPIFRGKTKKRLLPLPHWELRHQEIVTCRGPRGNLGFVSLWKGHISVYCVYLPGAEGAGTDREVSPSNISKFVEEMRTQIPWVAGQEEEITAWTRVPLVHTHMKASSYRDAWPTICKHSSGTFNIYFPKVQIPPFHCTFASFKTGTEHFWNTLNIAQEMEETSKYELPRVWMNCQVCGDEVKGQVKTCVGELIAPSVIALGSPIFLHKKDWQTDIKKYKRSSCGTHPFCVCKRNKGKKFTNVVIFWVSPCQGTWAS